MWFSTPLLLSIYFITFKLCSFSLPPPPPFALYYVLFHFCAVSHLSLSGSHGGRGGTIRSDFLEAGEAHPYGSVVAPLTFGSGGGLTGGGSGGGVIHLVGNVSVTINGAVTANGEDASGSGGGGAGGSIFIETLIFKGAGRITACGGNANNQGGGGGAGGRVTVNHQDSAYTGYLLAYGGLNGKNQMVGSLFHSFT